MSFEKDKFLEWLKGYSEYQEISAEATQIFDGLDFKDPNIFLERGHGLARLIDRVTDTVEKFARDIDDLSGRDKQEAVKDALDDLIKLPKLFEWVDNIVINAIVAAVVAKKNEFFGKDWVKD